MSTTTAWFADDSQRWGLVEGDSLQLLPRLPDASVDAVITDPPYNLAIADQQWDRKGTPAAYAEWTRTWASECRRILKPGGHLLAFGAPRTVHRLAAGIEDAGLEIRDQLIWLRPPGIPKARRLPGGQAAGLKPAHEPIVMARRPFAGRLQDNLDRHGTGALGIESAAIHTPDGPPRWPTNAVLSHGRGCGSRCHAACPIGRLDAARPQQRPSRFFYCASPDRIEREAGCQQLPVRFVQLYHGASRSGRHSRNAHPTVKPLALMRWLVRLACPPGGLVLDPFAGSGSTGAATVQEDRQFVGIERDGAYVDVACARITHWTRSRDDAR